MPLSDHEHFLRRLKLSSTLPQRTLSQIPGRGGPNQTYGCHWTVPLNTRAVIFVFANYLPDEPFVVEAAYASSCKIGDSVNPVDLNGQTNPNGLFRRITWCRGATTATIPPAFNKVIPAFIVSDPMPFTAFPRSDGASGALLLFRGFTSGTQSADFYDGSSSRVHAANHGFGGGWVNNATDSATFPFIAPESYGGAEAHGFQTLDVMAPHGLIAITDGPGLSILQTGDSVNSGVSASDGLLFPGLAAAREISSELGIPASCVNEAISGDLSENYIARASGVSKVTKFSVAMIQCYTRNDQIVHGDTVDTAMAAYNRAIIFARECLDNDIVPFLQTATPFCSAQVNGGSLSGFEANRRLINTFVRQAGFPYIDYDQLLGDGTTPNAYRPEFSTDGIHPTTRGMQVLGKDIASKIKLALPR